MLSKPAIGASRDAFAALRAACCTFVYVVMRGLLEDEGQCVRDEVAGMLDVSHACSHLVASGSRSRARPRMKCGICSQAPNRPSGRVQRR